MSGFKSNKDAVMAALDEALVEGMNASALAASRLVRRTLSQPGTGRVYRIGKGRKSGRNLRAQGLHRASAPGRPPAVNTNRLRSSWTVDSVTGFGSTITASGNSVTIYRDGKSIVLEYGSRVEYAPMLEYGTRRMKARPYLKPTLPVLARAIPLLFQTAIDRRFSK